VRAGNPNRIYDPQNQPVQETRACAFAGYHVGAEKENQQPAHRLNGERDQVHSGYSHKQTKQGELKNQFPIHGSIHPKRDFNAVVKIISEFRGGGKGVKYYSCADIWWSESRQALILRRRQTQHKFSASELDVGGPVSGVHEAPQTAQGLGGAVGRSASTDLFAISKIWGAIIGSFISFFFIPDYTIAHFGERLR
jgi:hypothetical protein